MIPKDTTADAARVQAEVWRAMTGARQVELAAEMSENVRRIAAEGVRRRHPDYTDDQDRDFSRTEFARRQDSKLLGVPVQLASAEDVVLSKLEWSKIGESERQIRDARRSCRCT